ncbi:unnamed protein product [Prunus armeniaca]
MFFRQLNRNSVTSESSLPEEENGEERTFGELKAPFPQQPQWETPILSYFSSFFIPPSMARSDEDKEVDIHASSKGASGNSQAIISWFLECFLLGTCSPHVLEPPAALFNKSLDLPLHGFCFLSQLG